jgi:transcriptional regulator with XRE-family HTH domain
VARRSARDAVLQLQAAGLSQAAIARRLGASVRSVRRWKNEGVTPSDKAASRLARAAADVGRKLRAHNRRISRGRQPVPDRPLPRGIRRKLKQYDQGKDTGRTYEAEWVNYPVRGMGIDDVIAILESLYDKSGGALLQVQLIFSTRLDDPVYWTDSRKASKREQKTGRKRAASTIENAGGWRSRDSARAFATKWLEGAGRVPLYIGVLDQDSDAAEFFDEE